MKRLMWTALLVAVGLVLWGGTYVGVVLSQAARENREAALAAARAIAAGDVDAVERVWTFGGGEAAFVVSGKHRGSPVMVWYDGEGKRLAARPWDAAVQERELRERLLSGAVHLPWDDGPSLQGGELVRLVPAYARGTAFWEAVVRTPDGFVYVDVDPEGLRFLRAFALPARGLGG
ncbi:hypothetical protein [Brockia lithotrophica]|uniref:DUF5590 domain-containing protein n=1 Tax=Brockia lithotrophica TaxID=933949 RepID=A0A660L3Y4_9BACL|nr:hypothetical protein [Brockia lithotrophica]RKQ88616.1 hypothetical protein C7438_0255 [Brockia lithotrophica]